MIKDNVQQRILYLLLLVSALVMVILINFFHEVRSITDFIDPEENAVSFNYSDGRYAEEIAVEIKKEHRFAFLTKIYYTLDGSEPTEQDMLYKGPVILSSEEGVSACSIRAAVFYRGGRSRITTGTYLVGEKALLCHTIPTLFLTGDEEGLYGEEAGILVPGKLYSDYLASGGTEEVSWSTPANFNQTDWMRRVNATLFDAGGNLIFSEICDLSVTGNSSRKYVQKPLKLTADTKFPLQFAGQQEASITPHITRYSKLKFRNCGMDFPETMLRGALAAELARQAGFEDAAMVQPTAIYINGAYYGVADMQTVYTNSYLADLYGLDRDKIEVFDHSENEILAALGYEEDESMDFCDPEFREEFERLVDVEQLLRYYAFELIIGNTDWPHNNMKMWRYTGRHVEGNPFTDGRGRFLLYDFDAVFECREDHQEPFETLFYNSKMGRDSEEMCDLIVDLLEYEEYRNLFVNFLMDDLSGALQTENILAVLERCVKQLEPELRYAFEESPFDEVRENLTGWSANVDRLRDVVSRRTEEVYSYIHQYFDSDTTYDLTVNAPENGNIIEVSSLRVYGGGESLTTTRCREYATPVRARVSKGQKFLYWLVNGQKVMDLTLRLTDEDFGGLSNGQIVVDLVTEPLGDACIMIHEVSEKGDTDYIELYNCGEKAAALNEYFLTDDEKEPSKYQCPDAQLLPGETIVINGKSNPVVSEYIMNFNLKGGERIYLYHQGKTEPEDTILIPDMAEGESYGRYCQTEEFRFFSNSALRKEEG